ncbi:MAG: response regulator [Dysgonamonadaceae bacterium]|jgi:signal transduction histidine kinase/ligand-binding sensor domain-containing protein/CheY-like chemotaxis protein/AraC-like DNA-binding protein|nr:response regulator [Dysgonamonadaceae bacterium]
MSRKLSKTALLIAFALIFTNVFAEYFNFRNYDVENGLPANCVRGIIQDSRGFMWFGTDNGLSRFDGHNFKNYYVTPDDSTSLGNIYIYSIFEDSRKNIWVGTDEGIFIYHIETDNFSAFNKKTSDNKLVSGHITAILEDKNKNIWISSLSAGVFCYEPETDILKYHGFNAVVELYIDSKNEIWAAPQRSQDLLYRFDRAKNEFVQVKLQINDNSANNFGIHAIFEDSKGNFWIGTWNSGLCLLDTNTGEIRSFMSPKKTNGISHIHDIAEYQTDILLVSSDDGLAIFNTDTYTYELMTASEFKRSTLSDNFLYPIVKDLEGGLWVGSYYGGVNYAPPMKGCIEGYSHSKYNNSVGGNIISCFCEDNDGNIWIGADDGGLSCFNPKTKQFDNYMPNNKPNSLSYYNLHALCFDGELIWIGAYSGGLNTLNIKTKQFKRYSYSASDSASLYGNSIYSIYKDDSGIWIGTMEGINLYNRAEDNFIRVREIGTTTIDIVSDASDNLWFATLGKGLFRYCKKDKKWTQYTNIKGDTASIPNDQINTLHVDSDNNLWLGTDRGIAIYNRESDNFKTVEPATLNGHICYIRNISGVLWITTTNGLITYNLSEGATRSFHKSDGMMSDQFNAKSGLMSSSGMLYLGTTNGFNIIYPNEISEKNIIPQIYITNIQVFNKDIDLLKHGSPIKSFMLADKVEFSHKENVFSIEFVAVSYIEPPKNTYKYWLEGFDKGWNEVGNQRKATYTNLPPGRYIFHVEGGDSDGLSHQQSKNLTIIIHPPFWKTTFAYFLYIMLVLSITTYIIYYFRRRSENKHREKMQQLQIEKDRELQEAKINFFTFVAHEIRTPVTLIISPLEKIMKEIQLLPDYLRDSLQIINSNSQRLLSLVNQLLDFRKAEEKAFTIKFAQHNIFEILNSVYIRFKHQCTLKNISLSLDVSNRETTAIVDAEALIKIVSNLLTNALKYAKSSIVISSGSENGFITISVADDGEGIAKEEQKNIFMPFYQSKTNPKSGTGIGLSLVKMLVDAHNGTVNVISTPGNTAFTIFLPEHQSVAPQENTLPEIIPDAGVQHDTLSADSLPTLLLAEDNADMRKYLHDNLSPLYNIIEASNGKEGIEKLRLHPTDLIISDIMMPIMNGIELLQTVRQNIEYSHIPVILLTAKTDDTTKLESMKTGADAYIEKPFSLSLLNAQIDNLIKQRITLRKRFSEMPFAPLNSIAGNSAEKDFLDKMNKLIESNIDNPDFNVDMMAENLCISRSGLFLKIKQLTEMTPNDLIQLIRLKKAAELLKKGDLRINEICFKVGFSSSSYFSKRFKEQFGVLPKDF